MFTKKPICECSVHGSFMHNSISFLIDKYNWERYFEALLIACFSSNFCLLILAYSSICLVVILYSSISSTWTSSVEKSYPSSSICILFINLYQFSLMDVYFITWFVI